MKIPFVDLKAQYKSIKSDIDKAIFKVIDETAFIKGKYVDEFEDKFWKSKSAETFYSNLPASVNDPMAELFKTSMQTVIKSRSRSSLNEKLPAILEINIDPEGNIHKTGPVELEYSSSMTMEETDE